MLVVGVIGVWDFLLYCCGWFGIVVRVVMWVVNVFGVTRVIVVPHVRRVSMFVLRVMCGRCCLACPDWYYP